MPVKVRYINGKYRIVEGDGNISTTSQGNPKDGGGHNDEDSADAQARAINAGIAKSGDKK
jgi:hypothetical protein